MITELKMFTVWLHFNRTLPYRALQEVGFEVCLASFCQMKKKKEKITHASPLQSNRTRARTLYIVATSFPHFLSSIARRAKKKREKEKDMARRRTFLFVKVNPSRII
jgi:hypothetical protein